MSKPIRFGLDISDHSAEIIGLSDLDGEVVIEWAGRMEIPAGIVRRGVIEDRGRLVNLLNQLLDGVFGAQRQTIEAVLALPETDVYSKAFSLPANLNLEMAGKAASIEAADIFPIDLEGSLTAVVEMPGTGDRRDYFFAAVESQVVDEYRTALQEVGVVLVGLESEAVALARALIRDRQEAAMVVDIGAAVTSMVVNDRGGVRLASVINIGGDALTSALEIKMNIPLEKAERFKRSDGLLPTKDRGRVYLVLQQPMAEIVQEIQETASFYASKSGRKITRMVLAGGNSLLPGMVDYMASSFPEMTVELGSPFYGIKLTAAQQAVGRQSIIFSTAIGSAWRAAGLRQSWGIDFLINDNRQTSGFKGLFGRLRRAGLAFSHMVQKKTAAARKAKPKASKPPKAMPAAPGKPAKKAAPNKRKPAPKKAAPKSRPTGRLAESVDEDIVIPTIGAPEVSPAEPEIAPVVEAATDAHDVLSMPEDASVVEEEPTEDDSADELQQTIAAADAQEDEEADSTYVIGSRLVADDGRGVGDIIHGDEETGQETEWAGAEDSSEAEPAEADVPAVGNGPRREKITVDTILARAKEAEAGYEASQQPVPVERGRGRLIALVSLVIVLAVATAGGVYMLMKKHGVNLAAYLPGYSVQPSELPLRESPKPSTPAQPQSVAVTVLLGTSAQPESSKPFVLTRAVETELEASDVFDSTGQAATANGRSEGTVKIVNTTSSEYTFVATTRFLTDEGVLFRLKENTVIPADGSVEAAVAADQPGAEYDIGPSKFTIPGLSAGLQSQIWGESSAAMSGGAGLAKAVAAADLSKAKADLLEKLKTQAETKLEALLQDNEVILPDLITSEEVSFEAPEAGSVSGNFKASLKARFRAMVLPEAEVGQELVVQLVSTLPEGENQADYDIGLPQYTVEAYDTKAGLAEVRAEAQISKTMVKPAESAGTDSAPANDVGE